MVKYKVVQKPEAFCAVHDVSYRAVEFFSSCRGKEIGLMKEAKRFLEAKGVINGETAFKTQEMGG